MLHNHWKRALQELPNCSRKICVLVPPFTRRKREGEATCPKLHSRQSQKYKIIGIILACLLHLFYFDLLWHFYALLKCHRFLHSQKSKKKTEVEQWGKVYKGIPGAHIMHCWAGVFDPYHHPCSQTCPANSCGIITSGKHKSKCTL